LAFKNERACHGHARNNTKYVSRLPFLKIEFFLTKNKLYHCTNLVTSITASILSALSGRENEARGQASEASAELFDFFLKSGLALPSRERTSSS